MLLQILLLGVGISQVLGDCNKITGAWNVGANGELTINVPTQTNGWKVKVTFDGPVDHMSAWQGSPAQCSGNVCIFENAPWNGYQNAGTTLKLGYQINFR